MKYLVNGFKSITIFAKSFILDIWQGPKHVSGMFLEPFQRQSHKMVKHSLSVFDHFVKLALKGLISAYLNNRRFYYPICKWIWR